MSLSAPLWLALWLLLPLWLLWRRRPREPALADTGALALWGALASPAGEQRSGRSRTSLAEWLAWLALFAASLALARPALRTAPGPVVVEVWVERLPGAFLPAAGGGGPSRLEAALAELVRRAERERPIRWRWRSPGAAAFETSEGAEGAARIGSLGPDPRPLEGWADDRAGALWLLLDPPAAPPRSAAWAVLEGDPVPGPVAIEALAEPGQEPRWIEWDGARLRPAGAAEPGLLVIDPQLPAWLREFAALWADARGLPSASAPGSAEPALQLGHGAPLEQPVRMRWSGIEFAAAPELGAQAAAWPSEAPWVEPRGEFEWSLGPASAPLAIAGSPGRLDWARASWEPPRGDPARVAVGLCRLFDRARRAPAACVPLEQRLARPRGPGRPGIAAAFGTALEGATAEQQPRPRSLALFPALLALSAALLAAALWSRREAAGAGRGERV